MCGLAGRIDFVKDLGSVPAGDIRAAAAALRHRGPDDVGIYEDPAAGISLAHTRLSILDLSPLGHQPMLSDDGLVVLCYNGETYNFRDLRIELERKGVMFRGQSDTEVVLRLYEHLAAHTDSGLKDFFTQLKGIFAVAIWDAQRRQLVLARDATGVKPLYYVQGSGHLAFASELKALLSLTHIPPVLDATAADQHLSFLWTPGDRTIWTGVKRLEPGTFLRVDATGSVSKVAWYRLPCHRLKSQSAAPAHALAKETVVRVRRAVERQMVADVPVGAFLSGGLDSSAIVHFAREIRPGLQCFTIRCDGPSDPGFVDDLPYAQAAARHLGVDLHVVPASASHLVEDLEAMIWHLDEPVADPAALNVLYISRAARAQGIKVLLSGVGADDIFSGYRRHLAVHGERYWTWLPRPLRAMLRKASQAAGASSAIGTRLQKAFAGADLDADERILNYFRWLAHKDLRALYSSGLSAAIGDLRSDEPMRDFLADLPHGLEPLERMLALEQRFFLAEHNLPYTDKMSMAAGVEVRVPFLDLELVEFAATVPASLKQRGRHGKWILKRAMEPYLPPSVIHRPKTGFGVPLSRWLKTELREWIRDRLSEETLRRRGLFEPTAVHKLLADNEAGRVHAPYTILSLACIEGWCQKFMDSHKSAAPRPLPAH